MPIDHEIFSRINSAQWMWYYFNFNKDQEDELTIRRDLIEYNAMFVAPEAVAKIRESRKSKVSVKEDAFAKGIKSLFGRELNLENKVKAANTTKNVFDVNLGPLYNHEYWANMDIQ